MWVIWLSQDFLNKALRRLWQSKCDSNLKDDMVQNSENNKPQLVLVHHLRFYGTKRSSRHQDGTRDKDMTQSPSLKP